MCQDHCAHYIAHYLGYSSPFAETVGKVQLDNCSEPIEKPSFLKKQSGSKHFSRNFLPKSYFQSGSNKYFVRSGYFYPLSTPLSKPITHNLPDIVNHTVQHPLDIHLDLSPQHKSIQPLHRPDVRKHRLRNPNPLMKYLPPPLCIRPSSLPSPSISSQVPTISPPIEETKAAIVL